MRGLSLIVLLLAVVVVGYLSMRTVEEHAPTQPGRESTADQVTRQVEDTLQQYQKKLDKQLENQ